MGPQGTGRAAGAQGALGSPSPDWIVRQFILAAYPLGSDAVGLPDVTEDQWQDVLQSARRASLSALLYASLRQLGRLDRVPSSVAGSLQTSFWQTGVSSRLMLEEYGALAQALAREAIPSVLLKGGALGPTLYPFEGTRPLTDIDILVPRSDEARTGRLLAERGFQPQVDGIGEFREHYLGQKIYCRQEGKHLYWVEVHWHVVDLPYYNQRIPIGWFWDRTRTVDLYGSSIRILSPTAQVMHLCAHLAIHHGGDGLLWLYDLALLLARNSTEIEWNQVVEATRTFGLALAVRRVLAAVRDAWDVDIPADARQQLEGLQASAGERVAYTAMAARQTGAGPLWDGIFAPELRLNGRYWLQALFPSREYMRKRYRPAHDLILPLYYACRIIAGIGKFARSGAGAVLRSRRADST